MSARPSPTAKSKTPPSKTSASKIPPSKGAKKATAIASGKRKTPVYALLVGLVAVLGVVAVVVSRNGASTADDAEIGIVTTSGAALPAMVAGATDPAAGLVAPTITGTPYPNVAASGTSDLLATTTETVTPGSSPMVMMFVAHWCPHCQAEVPKVTSWLAESGQPADVKLWAVATGTSPSLPNYPPSKWLADAGFPIRTIADDATNSAATAYGLTSYPYFVALDKDGKVAQRAAGELTKAQFDGLIEAARTGPPAAG